MKKLSDNPRGAFAESAERLGRIASDVKVQQITEMQGALPQAPRMSAISPDEVWSKNFMTQGIGAVPDLVGVSAMTPMPHATFVMTNVAAPPVVSAQSIKRPSVADNAPMSMRIGRKEERPKRSWLGRLLRGA